MFRVVLVVSKDGPVVERFLRGVDAIHWREVGDLPQLLE